MRAGEHCQMFIFDQKRTISIFLPKEATNCPVGLLKVRMQWGRRGIDHDENNWAYCGDAARNRRGNAVQRRCAGPGEKGRAGESRSSRQTGATTGRTRTRAAATRSTRRAAAPASPGRPHGAVPPGAATRHRTGTATDASRQPRGPAATAARTRAPARTRSRTRPAATAGAAEHTGGRAKTGTAGSRGLAGAETRIGRADASAAAPSPTPRAYFAAARKPRFARAPAAAAGHTATGNSAAARPTRATAAGAAQCPEPDSSTECSRSA